MDAQALIKDLSKRIGLDKLIAVTVIYQAERVFLNYTASQIKQNFGSADNFFKHLRERFPGATIIERRRNGSRKIKGQTKINYKTINTFTLDNPALRQPTTYVIPDTTPSLNAPQYGLAMPEIIGLNVDRVTKDRLEIENEFLKKENEELKKIRDEYKEFKLSTEYSQNKSKNNIEMFNGVLNSPVAQELVARLFAPPTTPNTGLNAPQQQDQFVNEYYSLDENSKNLFRKALYYSKNNSEFANDFFNLTEQQTSNAISDEKDN